MAANRHGYAGASVSEVIAQAGVSRPTFYDYFADRDACFMACITEVQQRLLDKVRTAVEGGAPEHAATAAIEALVAFAGAEPAMARFLMMEALAGEKDSLEARDRGTAEIAEVIEQAFAVVAREQAIPDLPLDAAIGAIQRLLGSRLRRGERALNATLDDLLSWMRSYERPAREHRWRTLTPTEGIARSPFLSATPPPAPPLLGPGRPRVSEELVAENHRQRIVFATSQAVAEHGYTGTTVAHITKLAGIDGRAFYRLFADKQEAFNAIYENAFRQTVAIVASAYFAGDSWPTRVWEATRAATQDMQDNPSAANVAFIAPYAAGSGAIQRVEDSRLAFTIFLQEGYRHEQVRNHPSRLGLEMIATVIFEILYHQARTGAYRETPGLLPHIVHLCLAPFTGPKQADRLIDKQLRKHDERLVVRGAVKPDRGPVRTGARGAAQRAG